MCAWVLASNGVTACIVVRQQDLAMMISPPSPRPSNIALALDNLAPNVLAWATLWFSVTLAEPSHSPSKPIYDPRELRVAKLEPNWFKDVGRHDAEVSVSAGAPAVESFEGVAYPADYIVHVFRRQFACHRFNDTP